MVEHIIIRWGQINKLVSNADGGVILPFLEQTPRNFENNH